MSKQKLKTHKGTQKRVSVTKTGKITRRRSSGNHLLSKKSESRKRAISQVAIVSGKMAKNVKRALGV